MIAWAIEKARHKATAFTGQGAFLVGGRWHREGTRMVYCAESLALAALETLVHLDTGASAIRYLAFRIDIPDAVVEAVTTRSLPRTWRRVPYWRTTQDVGDRWVSASESAVLRVPSAIIPQETNLLLNPLHPDLPRLRIAPPEPFSFDPRLRQ